MKAKARGQAPVQGPRAAGRDLAFRLLYQMDISGDGADKAKEDGKTWGGSGQSLEFARSLVEAVEKERGPIDQKIGEKLRGFTFDRLASVDRNLLRVALAENVMEDPPPPQVSVSEAVRLAEKYGDEKSPAFVNGILSEILGLKG